MEKGSTVIDAGAVNIAMEYRDDIMNDQGLCVQVYAEVEGKDTEILRFDCFDQDPHYHYGPENLNIRLFMDKTTAGNPLGWTMSQLRDKLPVMVERSGYDDLADKLRDNPVSSSVFDKAEKQGRSFPAPDGGLSRTCLSVNWKRICSKPETFGLVWNIASSLRSTAKGWRFT